MSSRSGTGSDRNRAAPVRLHVRECRNERPKSGSATQRARFPAVRPSKTIGWDRFRASIVARN